MDGVLYDCCARVRYAVRVLCRQRCAVQDERQSVHGTTRC